MARGRNSVGKDKDKDKERDQAPDPKYAMWIIAAIGKVKGQKQRPSEDRISHILETVYGLDPQVALEQLELCVKVGKVLKVVFKDKASYKDPAKVPRHIRGSIERPVDFIQFIKEALDNVGDENGCTQQQISNYITEHHAASLDSVSDTQTRLKESLKKGLASEAFVKEGRFYRLPILPKKTEIHVTASSPDTFSSPEPTIFLACGRDRELWLVPNHEVRESRTSGSSAQTQKFEAIVVANCYKNAPLLRLRIFRNWPELSISATSQKDRELWGREWP